MGPYATGAILSAMGVRSATTRCSSIHTFGIPVVAKYEMQFPRGRSVPEPGTTVPEHGVRCARGLPKPPKTIAVVTEQVSVGALHVARRARGREEARPDRVLFLEWDFGNLDYGPIAARIKDAKPDFLWVGALDSRATSCSRRCQDRLPPRHFYMYPAPGPMSKSPLAKTRCR
jgi:branched-chain amino acid transport system substrate-binding protein